MFQMMGVFAEFERAMIQERVRAGLARARSEESVSVGLGVAASQWVSAFRQRLRELGRIEGNTVAIEYRWDESREQRFAEIMAEFIRLTPS
jgi:DNA invertase Pin-like site-specific DNA recombinase